MRSRHINVRVDLERIRASAQTIRDTTRVELIAVVKADAYGLGAEPVAAALAGVADEFAYFTIHEAREVGRPGIVLGPPEAEPSAYRELSLRPIIASEADARRYAGLRGVVSVDTGMQRFGCPIEAAQALARLAAAADLCTHARDAAAVAPLAELRRALGLRTHAASSCLLDRPSAWLDAVRPGVALYRGALRVSTRLQSVRQTHGPVGYSGFVHRHVGILLGGYSNRLAPASVLINGRRQRILEVGMNTAFVSVDPSDRAGDEVVLLGEALTEAQLAAELGVREHEVLCRYGSMGPRDYVNATGTTKSPAPALRQT